jgi:hypothetical protein
MDIRNVIVKMLFFVLVVSCGSYDMGYKDGYKDVEKKSWIIFRKDEYYRGYLDGRFNAWCDKLKKVDHERYKKECLLGPESKFELQKE